MRALLRACALWAVAMVAWAGPSPRPVVVTDATQGAAVRAVVEPRQGIGVAEVQGPGRLAGHASSRLLAVVPPRLDTGTLSKPAYPSWIATGTTSTDYAIQLRENPTAPSTQYRIRARVMGGTSAAWIRFRVWCPDPASPHDDPATPTAFLEREVAVQVNVGTSFTVCDPWTYIEGGHNLYWNLPIAARTDLDALSLPVSAFAAGAHNWDFQFVLQRNDPLDGGFIEIAGSPAWVDGVVPLGNKLYLPGGTHALGQLCAVADLWWAGGLVGGVCKPAWAAPAAPHLEFWQNDTSRVFVQLDAASTVPAGTVAWVWNQPCVVVGANYCGATFEEGDTVTEVTFTQGVLVGLPGSGVYRGRLRYGLSAPRSAMAGAYTARVVYTVAP